MHRRVAMFPRMRLTAFVIAIGAFVGACAETPAEPQIQRYEALEPGQCRAWQGQPIERICVPRIARQNVELALEISESCSPCGTADKCTVTVEGKEVVLSLDGQVCAPKPGAQCNETCARKRVVCKVPPLQSGRYIVRRADTSGDVNNLEVTTDATAVSRCSFAEAEKGS